MAPNHRALELGEEEETILTFCEFLEQAQLISADGNSIGGARWGQPRGQGGTLGVLQCPRIMVMMLAAQVCTLILLHPATQSPPFPNPSTNSHYPLQAPGPLP